MLKIREHWKDFKSISRADDRVAAWEGWVKREGFDDMYDAVPHHMAAALVAYLEETMGNLEGVTAWIEDVDPEKMEMTFSVYGPGCRATIIIDHEDPEALSVRVLMKPAIVQIPLRHPITGKIVDTLEVEHLEIDGQLDPEDLQVEEMRVGESEIPALEELSEDLVRKVIREEVK